MTFKSLTQEFSHLNVDLYPPLIHSMGTAARVAVATEGSTVGNYSIVVFTFWNYGCLGDRATKLQQKNIHYRLQVRGDLYYLTRWRKRNVINMWQFFFLQFYTIISTKWHVLDNPLHHLSVLCISGGSGGGENKKTGSCSNFISESCVILLACSYVFCCIWAHYSSLLLHLFGHQLQPGKWYRSRVMVLMWSC